MVALALLSMSTPWATADQLAAGFLQPPEAARPRVWWHWMNGNVTKDGITRDFEWMHRVGLGGVQIFDADIGTAQYVEQRVAFMTPVWLDHVQYAVQEAGRLGLEVTMTPTSGWSQSGGPWVKPAEAMKKYVWSETRVDGPRRFEGVLPAPPAATGPFQNIAYRGHSDNLPPPDGAPGGKPYTKPRFQTPGWYADAAVIAYRLPDGEQALPAPAVTSHAGQLLAAGLADGDFETKQPLPVAQQGRSWLQLDYGKSVRMQSVTVALGPVAFPNGAVRVSDDGVNFHTVAALPGASHTWLTVTPGVRTYAFPETAARYVRLELDAPLYSGLDAVMGKPKPTSHGIAEFTVGVSAQVHRFQDKAGFSMVPEYESLVTPAVAADRAVSGATVVDLTGRLHPDGTLDWEVPAGRWAIMRLGYSLTGQLNDPSSQEGKGLEVDKLSAVHVRSNLQQFMAPIQARLRSLVGAKGLSHLLLDSWEANQQNWTDDMLAEFRRRRGYDPLRWLPVLGGRVVDSAEDSDRFLFDFRRTIADLLTDNHYAATSDYAHTNGMQTYGEAVGVNFPTLGDGLAAKGRMDIPMGEFWDRRPDEKPEAAQVADVREAASAAHIYGKTLVAAEAFTATPMVPPWSRSPRDHKWLADYNLALGINRFVFHTSVHQPFDDRKPGVSLWLFGQNFTRHETWAEQAGPWITYLSRASYMMQQGHAVNDIAYFIGEGAPALAPYHEPNRPAIPEGYGYDYVNLEVLLERMTVNDGRLELPGGASYRLLVLPATTNRLSLPLLRKLRDLVAAGGHVIAARPTGAPGLVEGQDYAAIVAELWGDADGRTVTGHAHGKGKVYWGAEVADVMEQLKTAPDVRFAAARPDSQLVTAHRRAGDADIYFVANQRQHAEPVKASFRISGKKPELWYADTGRIVPAAYTTESGCTVVSVDLEAQGSVFVVFREQTNVAHADQPLVTERVAATVATPWTVRFPDVDQPLTLGQLVSWHTLAPPAVRYFSGTADYRNTLVVQREWLKSGRRVLLDLGQVDVMAQVSVNGKPAGILWKAPYRADITALVKPGANTVQVKVTNLWVNRLVGDTEKDGGPPRTFTTFKPYRAGAELKSSGLIGPVRVVVAHDESNR
jgi:hypothetical protein